jgi:hypothetical protein
MNKIFFEQKGSTIKANVDYIWPNKILHQTPPAFFEALDGLFVIINPSHIDRRYFTFSIFVYSALNVKYIQYPNAAYASTPLLATATYDRKRLTLNFPSFPAEEQEHWYDVHNMIELVREAVAKCDIYFPKQKP